MRSSHSLAAIETTFDEDNLVANAGLLVPGALAQKLGVAELVDEHLKLPVDAVGRANGGTKAMTVIGPQLGADLTVDFDSTICRTYGTGKQGARFGYTGVRGYHPLLATLASTGEVLHARMRGGNAGAARGAGSFVRETVGRIRGAGATDKLTFRAPRRSTPARS